jgi:hypothetical protein
MFTFIKQRSAMAREAEGIVGLICQAFPLSEQSRLADARLKKRSAASVRRIALAARNLAQESHAGVIGRAYVANRVRWSLCERGYGDEFVGAMTSSIVIAMHS